MFHICFTPCCLKRGWELQNFNKIRALAPILKIPIWQLQPDQFRKSFWNIVVYSIHHCMLLANHNHCSWFHLVTSLIKWPLRLSLRVSLLLHCLLVMWDKHVCSDGIVSINEVNCHCNASTDFSAHLWCWFGSLRMNGSTVLYSISNMVSMISVLSILSMFALLW